MHIDIYIYISGGGAGDPGAVERAAHLRGEAPRRAPHGPDADRHVRARERRAAFGGQKQIDTPLKADQPERPTVTLGWSLEHPLGILTDNVLLLEFMVSRSGWSRNRGVFICSQGGAK